MRVRKGARTQEGLCMYVWGGGVGGRVGGGHAAGPRSRATHKTYARMGGWEGGWGPWSWADSVCKPPRPPPPRSWP